MIGKGAGRFIMMLNMFYTCMTICFQIPPALRGGVRPLFDTFRDEVRGGTIRRGMMRMGMMRGMMRRDEEEGNDVCHLQFTHVKLEHLITFAKLLTADVNEIKMTPRDLP